MKKRGLLLSVWATICLLMSIPLSANAQIGDWVRERLPRGNRGGRVIRLETTSHPNTQFSGLPGFTLRFEDKRNSTIILQKYDGPDSKPEVSTDKDPFEFVKTELGNYMAQLGFLCSEFASKEISLTITLDKFDVGYYSGKGWAANVILGLSLVDQFGEVYYEKAYNRGRVEINGSATDYDAMGKALNQAWNSLLGIIDWTAISSALQKAAVPKTAPVAAGTQIVNVTNVYNQQITAPTNVNSVQTETAAPYQRKLSDVDENIPISETNSNINTYVLIIANENYKDLQKVNYALSDAESFKEYCIKTLGIPQKQIFYYVDATYGEMGKAFGKMEYVLEEFEGKRAIVYYCGHGTNDESTGKSYIVPVDGDAKGSTLSYNMEDIYKNLSETKAVSITYFLDACFSGTSRDGGMLVEARGTARAPKKDILEGNTIVFSASSNDETAMPYEEKGHGLFTYYLLKGLQESKGNITYENLDIYISENVNRDAFLINEKPQHPMVATSPGAMNSWKNMKLK